MEWIKRFLFIGLVILLSSCALALPKRILPVTGQVIDQASGQPVEGAIIVMRWQGTGTMAFVDQQTQCYHVETATTDAEGRFSTKAWREASQYRNLGLKERMDTVYKAGYRHVRSKDGVYYLKRDRGSVEKRLEYLDSLIRSVGCFGSGKSERNLYMLRKFAFYEAKNTGAPQDFLQSMRKLAASAWLAQDGSTSWSEHNKNISEFLKDHLL